MNRDSSASISDTRWCRFGSINKKQISSHYSTTNDGEGETLCCPPGSVSLSRSQIDVYNIQYQRHRTHRTSDRKLLKRLKRLKRSTLLYSMQYVYIYVHTYVQYVCIQYTYYVHMYVVHTVCTYVHMYTYSICTVRPTKPRAPYTTTAPTYVHRRQNEQRQQTTILTI